MKKKIICMILASFFILNIGAGITSIGKSEKINNNEKISLNDVRIEPIQGNEEELIQIEQKPLTTYTTGVKSNCAVVIQQYLPHSLGLCMSNTCQYVITNLQNRGYENILYIDVPTTNKLKDEMIDFIVNNIGGQKKLFFYVAAHGNVGFVQINPFQILTDTQFASYINQVSSYYSICNVVMESCKVGSFINDLSGPNRVIITSTDSDSSSYGVNGGRSPFSEKIFLSFGAGKNLKESWEDADSYICSNRLSFPGQNPQLDDNGNGYGVGTYKNADQLPMDDGHTANKNNWDGNLAAKSNVRSKQFNYKFMNLLAESTIVKILSIIKNIFPILQLL